MSDVTEAYSGIGNDPCV